VSDEQTDSGRSRVQILKKAQEAQRRSDLVRQAAMHQKQL
jgi:hypothetical protein